MGVGAMAGVQALLFPLATVLMIPLAYALGSLLIVPAGVAAAVVKDSAVKGRPSTDMVSPGLYNASWAALYSALPWYGPALQLMCLGPAACLMLPALALVPLPLTTGVAGGVGRAVTHRKGVKDVVLAGMRIMLVTAAVAWPAALAALALAAVGGVVWGGGSMSFLFGGGGPPGDASDAEAKRNETARYTVAARWCLIAGVGAAALGAAVVVGAAALLIGPPLLWPLLDHLGDSDGAR